jgi:hypothetical protein
MKRRAETWLTLIVVAVGLEKGRLSSTTRSRRTSLNSRTNSGP